MMFSTRAEYGVRVMVALANEQVKDGVHATPASLAQIADDNGLPFAYLEHLAARLKKAGLVESRRGPRGGYLLARQAEDITMAQIVEALEGQIAPIECISQADDGASSAPARTTAKRCCPTKILWTRVQGSIVRSLTEMTLADLTAANDRAIERLTRRSARNRSPSRNATGPPAATDPTSKQQSQELQSKWQTSKSSTFTSASTSKRDPSRRQPAGQQGRDARADGSQRQRQVDARQRPDGQRHLRGHRRPDHLQR